MRAGLLTMAEKHRADYVLAQVLRRAENLVRALVAERDAAWADAARLRDALEKALPLVEETYRWHRVMQSHIGKTLDAHSALIAARAALAQEPRHD